MSRLVEFRTFEVSFTADIPKMYRQILIDPDQTKLQRILWRDSPDSPVKIFELQTVTYGTASASYLAIQSIRKVAEENVNKFPLGAKVILNHFYVDDVLSGASTVEEAFAMKEETLEVWLF